MKRITLSALCTAAVLSLAATAPATLQDPAPKPEAVPPVPSVERGDKAELGKVAPTFKIKDFDGKDVSLSDYKGRKIVCEWFNPGCPFVVAAYEKGPLKEMRKRYAEQGIVWLTINSNAAGKEGSDPKQNREFAKKHGLTGPILYDGEGVIGRAYNAKTTPHMYLINEKGVLVYSGALDNAPMGRAEGDGKIVCYVDDALADIAAGRAVKVAETKSYGCSVKYASKPGS